MDVESDNYEYLRGKLAKYGLNNGEPIVDFVARLDESRRRAAEDNAAVLRILDVAEGTRAPQAVGDLLGAVRTHRRTIEGLVRRLQDAQVKRKALEDVIVSSQNAAKEAGEAAMRANASRLVLKTALRKIEAEADRFGRREGEDVPAFICRQGGDNPDLKEFLHETAKLGRLGGESPMAFVRRLDGELCRLQRLADRHRRESGKSDAGVQKDADESLYHAIYGADRDAVGGAGAHVYAALEENGRVGRPVCIGRTESASGELRVRFYAF